MILFQTEKHSEIASKILHLNYRLKEAQEKNAKAGESTEDSLDAFMSSLNTSTLSKSDITKMKVELQNLRREEMKLIKLINLTKPANLPPLVSQVQAEDRKDDLQQKSKLSIRKVSQLEKRRKLFEANVRYLFSYSFIFFYKIVLFMIKKRYVFQNKGDSERDSSTLYSNNMDNEEEEEEEDDDQEDKNEDNIKEKGNEEDEEDANVHKSEFKKSIPYKDETESNNSMKTDDKPCIMRSVDQETRKQNVNVADDKKRKKDSKSEKMKGIKKQYDQDVHSEDYSTWVPPQDQSGDGRTNLNDKYGY